jgi:hypothetical protein
MADAEKPEPAPAPPPPSHVARRSLWARIRPLFSPHTILAIATLALVVVAIVQHFDTVDAVEATKRLAIASENAAKDRRQTTSADLILKIDATLAEHRYDKMPWQTEILAPRDLGRGDAAHVAHAPLQCVHAVHAGMHVGEAAAIGIERDP